MCASDEYLSDETCVKCNNVASVAIVAVSFISFVAVTLFMKDKVTKKSTMVEIKNVTTFFQCAQLTTLVDIPWPKIALLMPFTFPYGDSKCLVSHLGWDQQRTFYVYVYGALLLLTAVIDGASRKPQGSLNRRESFQQAIFLTLLWYAPLVQSAASMYRCVEDAEWGLVLAADPSVSLANRRRSDPRL